MEVACGVAQRRAITSLFLERCGEAKLVVSVSGGASPVRTVMPARAAWVIVTFLSWMANVRTNFSTVRIRVRNRNGSTLHSVGFGSMLLLVFFAHTPETTRRFEPPGQMRSQGSVRRSSSLASEAYEGPNRLLIVMEGRFQKTATEPFKAPISSVLREAPRAGVPPARPKGRAALPFCVPGSDFCRGPSPLSCSCLSLE